MENKKISWIVYLLLSLIILRHTTAIITNLINLRMYDDGTEIIMNIGLSLVMIAALVLMLRKNIWGIYLFVCIQVLSSVFNSIMKGDALIHFGVAALMCLIMFLLLQIRENGISAWKVITKNNCNDERTTI